MPLQLRVPLTLRSALLSLHTHLLKYRCGRGLKSRRFQCQRGGQRFKRVSKCCKQNNSESQWKISACIVVVFVVILSVTSFSEDSYTGYTITKESAMLENVSLSIFSEIVSPCSNPFPGQSHTMKESILILSNSYQNDFSKIADLIQLYPIPPLLLGSGEASCTACIVISFPIMTLNDCWFISKFCMKDTALVSIV